MGDGHRRRSPKQLETHLERIGKTGKTETNRRTLPREQLQQRRRAKKDDAKDAMTVVLRPMFVEESIVTETDPRVRKFGCELSERVCVLLGEKTCPCIVRTKRTSRQRKGGGGTQRRTFRVRVGEFVGLSLRRAISSGAKESDGGER